MECADGKVVWFEMELEAIKTSGLTGLEPLDAGSDIDQDALSGGNDGEEFLRSCKGNRPWRGCVEVDADPANSGGQTGLNSRLPSDASDFDKGQCHGSIHPVHSGHPVQQKSARGLPVGP